MKRIALILPLIVISLAFYGCKGKADTKKAARTEQSANKKILSIENYSYDGNREIVEITSGIDNKKTKFIKTYDDRHNLLKNYCETDGSYIENEYNQNNQRVYSKDNGGPGHEYFYEYDANGDMIYFHSTIGGKPYLFYHAEYENHKLIHRYSETKIGEDHEWWRYSDNYTKCTYEKSSSDETEYFEYDSKGNKMYQKSYLGETFYEYDADNHLISQKNVYEGGRTSSTTYEYDSKGNKILENDGLYAVHYDYDFYEDGKIKSIVSYRLQ
ncbi:MAG: hypothetical protein K6G52_00145 [Treponemataceae bacterium]|nr:hypothetical protein [Treponemataceae bacterium]